MGRRKYDLPNKIWVENHGDGVWWENPHQKGYTEYYRKDIIVNLILKVIACANKLFKFLDKEDGK